MLQANPLLEAFAAWQRFFDGENVPDFVAKRDDLEYYFKTLAPPEMPNKTDDGKPEQDPFAAPDP